MARGYRLFNLEALKPTPWKKSYDQPRWHIEKQRHYFANKGPSSQGYCFSISHVWTGWIFLQYKGLLRVFSNTTVQKHQFFSAQLSSQSNSHIHTGDRDQDHPHGKEMQKSKMAVWGGLTNSCEERQKAKEKRKDIRKPSSVINAKK